MAIANNHNGLRGEEALVEYLRRRQIEGRTQVAQPGGGRRHDFVGQVPGENRIIIGENKTGFVTSNEHTRHQADVDGNLIAENRRVRGEGKRLVQRGVPLRMGGGTLAGIGLAQDAAEILGAYEADRNRIGENTGRALAGVAGGNLSGLGGSTIGGYLGMPGGPFGVAAGALIGGLGLGTLGDLSGRWLFDNYNRRLSADDIPPSLNAPMP